MTSFLRDVVLDAISPVEPELELGPDSSEHEFEHEDPLSFGSTPMATTPDEPEPNVAVVRPAPRTITDQPRLRASEAGPRERPAVEILPGAPVSDVLDERAVESLEPGPAPVSALDLPELRLDDVESTEAPSVVAGPAAPEHAPASVLDSPTAALAPNPSAKRPERALARAEPPAQEPHTSGEPPRRREEPVHEAGPARPPRPRPHPPTPQPDEVTPQPDEVAPRSTSFLRRTFPEFESSAHVEPGPLDLPALTAQDMAPSSSRPAQRSRAPDQDPPSTKPRPPLARQPAPHPREPREPSVHIGRIDIIVESPLPAPSSTSGSAPRRSLDSSAALLRRL